VEEAGEQVERRWLRRERLLMYARAFDDMQLE
jgi:hypothetical protein